MTDAAFLSKLEDELYLCEKMAVVLSEAGGAHDDGGDNTGHCFRAIAEVGKHLSSKLLDLRSEALELSLKACDDAKSENRTAAQNACKQAHEAVREIEPQVATLEAQMILLDMAIESMMGSRSTETAGAGLSNLQGAMNSSIKGINRTWTAAHEATKTLKESAQTARETDHV
ncbi:hypothetical protein [Pelagibius sp. Alg239-R121]|uniref:hypothetical protein n=1 Tax=Pelagibius sp. Alg239-R121 TaxID=2993448 RepID=UPI0024A6CEC7|nr:hypothetical protein [Pelagibius sp. Alg239-R121]